MVSHQDGLLMAVFNQGESFEGGLSSEVFHQFGISSGWSLEGGL